MQGFAGGNSLFPSLLFLSFLKTSIISPPLSASFSPSHPLANLHLSIPIFRLPFFPLPSDSTQKTSGPVGWHQWPGHFVWWGIYKDLEEGSLPCIPSLFPFPLLLATSISSPFVASFSFPPINQPTRSTACLLASIYFSLYVTFSERGQGSSQPFVTYTTICYLHPGFLHNRDSKQLTWFPPFYPHTYPVR